jgi:transmembrane sensor
VNSRHRANAAPDDPPPKVTPKIAAEAATWVARLHGPDRTRAMELQCLAWQARSAAHRHAFERCTEVWMEVPNAARAAGYVPTPRSAPGKVRRDGQARRRVPAITTMAVLALVLVLGVVGLGTGTLWPGGTEYRTALGEAQTVVLSDGTRMSLNTDTHVRVAFRPERRAVHVASGEVAFDVAKDTSRPFVVRAGDSEVEALGTSFSVRLTPPGQETAERLSVTLLEGQVALRPAAGGDGQSLAPARAVLMRPGERVQLDKAPGAATSRQQIDHPSIDQVTAWLRNEVVFDRTPLKDAVAAMNRYSTTPIVLADPEALADRLISGVYRTGDNAGFARAVAAAHGLAVHERQDRLDLAPGP